MELTQQTACCHVITGYAYKCYLTVKGTSVEKTKEKPNVINSHGIKQMNYRRHEAQTTTRPAITTLSYFLPNTVGHLRVLQLYRTPLIFSKIK